MSMAKLSPTVEFNAIDPEPDSRPVGVFLDGEKIGEIVRSQYGPLHLCITVKFGSDWPTDQVLIQSHDETREACVLAAIENGLKFHAAALAAIAGLKKRLVTEGGAA